MTTESKSKTISICMNIEDFMRNNKYPRDYSIFQQGDGKPMPPADALVYLTMEKLKGNKVIPCGSECGNPCRHADNGCAGFDYQGGGCPGRYTNTKEPKQ